MKKKCIILYKNTYMIYSEKYHLRMDDDWGYPYKSSIFYGIVIIKQLFWGGVLWFSYGFPMVFLWFSHGFPMVFGCHAKAPITGNLANCAAVTTDKVEPQVSGAKTDKVRPVRAKPRDLGMMGSQWVFPMGFPHGFFQWDPGCNGGLKFWWDSLAKGDLKCCDW